jgi:hypothetical protein
VSSATKYLKFVSKRSLVLVWFLILLTAQFLRPGIVSSDDRIICKGWMGRKGKLVVEDNFVALFWNLLGAGKENYQVSFRILTYSLHGVESFLRS